MDNNTVTEWLTGDEVSKDLVKPVDLALLKPINSWTYGRPLLPENLEKMMDAREAVEGHSEDVWSDFDLSTRVEACDMTLEAMRRGFDTPYEIRSKGNTFFIYFGLSADRSDVERFVDKFNEDQQHSYGQFAGRGSIRQTQRKHKGPEVWMVEVVQV